MDPANSYGPAVAALLAGDPLPPLGPGSPSAAARAALTAFDPLADLGRPVVDADAARACHAGLWLLHDGLDESHAISQELHTPEGSAWHAVMHRREPDAWNSKYWWRRVGDHPAFRSLSSDENASLTWKWDPIQFVDACEAARGSGGVQEMALRRAQLDEWRALFDWCYRKAVGDS